MGGHGSGKPPQVGARHTTNSVPAIDIRELQRRSGLFPGLEGYISWSDFPDAPPFVSVSVAASYIEFSYRERSASPHQKYVNTVVTLDRTDCHLGGERPWFRCPKCVARVAILYLGDNGFTCRRCSDLAYTSQKLSPSRRHMRNAQWIREQLGGSGSLFEPFPKKPKGMHWQRYYKLYMKATQAEARTWGLLSRRWVPENNDK